MAQPVVTAFDSGSTTTNASSYATTSKTFTAGRLYVLAAGTTVGSPLDATSVKFTVNTTAWTKALGKASAAGDMTVWLIKGLAITDTVTIDYNAVAQSGQDWIIFEITGWFDDSTILDALQQTTIGATGNSTTPSATLGSAPTTGNLTLGFAFQPAVNAAYTAGANFTKVTETAGHASPNARMAGEKDTGTPQQTAAWTATTGQWIAMVLELRSADATAAPAAVAVTVTVPNDVVTVAAAPSAVAVTVTVPNDVVTVKALPSAVAVTVTVPNDVVTLAAVPSAVAVTVTLPQDVVTVTALPAAVAVTVAVPVSGPNTVASPATIAVTVGVGQSAVSVAALPSAIVVTVTVPQSVVTATSTGNDYVYVVTLGPLKWTVEAPCAKWSAAAPVPKPWDANVADPKWTTGTVETKWLIGAPQE